MLNKEKRAVCNSGDDHRDGKDCMQCANTKTRGPLKAKWDYMKKIALDMVNREKQIHATKEVDTKTSVNENDREVSMVCNEAIDTFVEEITYAMMYRSEVYSHVVGMVAKGLRKKKDTYPNKEETAHDQSNCDHDATTCTRDGSISSGNIREGRMHTPLESIYLSVHASTNSGSKFAINFWCSSLKTWIKQNVLSLPDSQSLILSRPDPFHQWLLQNDTPSPIPFPIPPSLPTQHSPTPHTHHNEGTTTATMTPSLPSSFLCLPPPQPLSLPPYHCVIVDLVIVTQSQYNANASSTNPSLGPNTSYMFVNLPMTHSEAKDFLSETASVTAPIPPVTTTTTASTSKRSPQYEYGKNILTALFQEYQSTSQRPLVKIDQPGSSTVTTLTGYLNRRYRVTVYI